MKLIEVGGRSGRVPLSTARSHSLQFYIKRSLSSLRRERGENIRETEQESDRGKYWTRRFFPEIGRKKYFNVIVVRFSSRFTSDDTLLVHG